MSALRFDPARAERAYVLGLGLSGAAAARLLRRRGVEVVASDRRAAAALGVDDLVADAGTVLELEVAEPRLPAGIDVVVTSPGVALTHPLLRAARSAGVPVIAEVELAFVCLGDGDATVVGITGSNGKSTTTAMAGHLLKSAGFAVEVCGNIGLPLAAVVEGAPGRTFVVELSSFQLETIDRFRPDAAALLNISPDHLDRHGDLAGYLAAKQRIFMNQTADDVAVLNADEPEVAASPTRGRKWLFSSKDPAAPGLELAAGEVEELASSLRAAGLPGVHNVENAMAAALLARAVGAPAESVAPALASFRGLPHRVERVAEVEGVTYYDDSKGTNVAATAKSLEGFADRSVHLILGGRNKGADFGYLSEAVARKAKRIYLIGESAELLERSLGSLVPGERSGTLANAVSSAAAAARPGEVVLLSPACASFDQFRDYHDRGQQFARLVQALAERGAGGAG
jgi:UDP-N-acetylmuramoylalanine--D-glutamate ligase